MQRHQTPPPSPPSPNCSPLLYQVQALTACQLGRIATFSVQSCGKCSFLINVGAERVPKLHSSPAPIVLPQRDGVSCKCSHPCANRMVREVRKHLPIWCR